MNGNLKAKQNVAGSAGSNHNPTIFSSESEYNRTIENREEECSRSLPREPSPFKAEKQETEDQMLTKVGPALIKQSDSQLILPMAQLRTLAFYSLFVSVPDPSSVSLVYSLLPLGDDQFSPDEVCIDNC